MDQIEFSLWKLSAPCKPNVVKNPSVHICFEVEPSAVPEEDPKIWGQSLFITKWFDGTGFASESA